MELYINLIFIVYQLNNKIFFFPYYNMEDDFIPPPPPLPSSLRVNYSTLRSKAVKYKNTTYYIDLDAKIDHSHYFLDTTQTDYTLSQLENYIHYIQLHSDFLINALPFVDKKDYYSFLLFADGGLASLLYPSEDAPLIVDDKYLSMPLCTVKAFDISFSSYKTIYPYPIPFITHSILLSNTDTAYNTFLAFLPLYTTKENILKIKQETKDLNICSMFSTTLGANYFFHKFKPNLDFKTIVPESGTIISLPIQKITNSNATVSFIMDPFDYERFSYLTLLQTYLYCRVNPEQWITFYQRYNNKQKLRNIIQVEVLDETIQLGPSYDFIQPEYFPINEEALKSRNKIILSTDVTGFDFYKCKSWMKENNIATEILANLLPEGNANLSKILEIWKERIQLIKNYIATYPSYIDSFTESTLFKGQPFGSKVSDHIIGFYDLELEPKPYDYHWSTNCIQPFIPLPYNSSEELVPLTSEFIEASKIDVIEGHTIYEYYVQDLADSIISFYYGLDKQTFQRQRRDKTLRCPILKREQYLEMYNKCKSSFIQDDNKEKVFIDMDQLSEKSGYDINFETLDIGNLLFLPTQNNKVEIIYIKNCLSIWEAGFTTMDYISNLICPQYPKTMYNTFVPVQQVYMTYNIGLERGLFKRDEYSVLTYTFMQNLDLMNSIYCWCEEYEKAKQHTEQLVKNWIKNSEEMKDMGIWNRRELQAFHKLKNICTEYNLASDVGTIVYRSIESNMGKSIINISCVLREIILNNHSIQLKIENDVETYSWVYSPIGVQKNRNLCQQKKTLERDNPCRPCWNQGIALSSHEYVMFP